MPEPELTDDQLELASRYNLSTEEVKRVRGKTWAEKCEDAQRLAAIPEARPNRGEIAALEANKYEQHQRIVDLFHPPAKSEGGEGS